MSERPWEPAERKKIRSNHFNFMGKKRIVKKKDKKVKPEQKIRLRQGRAKKDRSWCSVCSVNIQQHKSSSH